MKIKFALVVVIFAQALHAMMPILIPTQAMTSSNAQNKFFHELILERVIEGNIQESLDALRKGLECGFHVQYKDSLKRTLLHILATHDAVDLVQYLLKVGADAQSKDINGCTPLHFAIHSAHALRIIQELVKAGADVNAQDFFGNTPLMYAVMSAKKLAVCVLLDTPKIHSMIKNSQGKTAYDIAKIYYPKIAKLLKSYTTLKGLSLRCIKQQKDKLSHDQIKQLPLELQEALQ
jgi:hypothetical protein